MNGLHSGEHAEKHWRGEYFGPNGAIKEARDRHSRAVSESNSVIDSSKARQKSNGRLLEARMSYLSTLYSAFTHSIKQLLVAKDLTYIDRMRECYREMQVPLAWSIEKRGDANFKDEYREVLMAILLLLRFFDLKNFFRYRRIAIELGQDIISADWAPHSTFMLASARLSRLSFYKPLGYESRAQLKKHLSRRIREYDELEVLGWKTINRIARLIGDKEMVRISAEQDKSPDVTLKSGLKTRE